MKIFKIISCMKKYIFLLMLSVFIYGGLRAQNFTLEQCREHARNNYPLVKQFGLIEKTAGFNLSSVEKAYLPQVNFSARATYQSDITQLPPELGQAISQFTGKPFSFPSLTKDQYQAVIDVSQVIWDGGAIKAHKNEIKANAEVDKRKLESELYTLNERVHQLFFGILLLDEQLAAIRILQNELQINFDKIKALRNNGMANQTDEDMIMVEQINARQRETDLLSARKSFIEILGALTGLALNENSKPEKPAQPELVFQQENKRPELLLFDAQNDVLESKRQLIDAGNLPKMAAFVQGGYGKPGLNMLTNDFSAFYLAGLRLSWNLSNLYTRKNSLQTIGTGKKVLEVQKETFNFNIELLNKQQKNEIEKLNLNLQNDEKIISLRKNIKKATEKKLQNGTAIVTDLLREVNAENLALQNRLLHEIQLLSAIYQYKNNINN